MSQSGSTFDELLARAEHTAFHLEMRDVYSVDYERDDFAEWRRTGRWDNPEYWGPWIGTVRDAVARGVTVRRIRLLSTPASDSMRFEHAGTVNNLAGGEEVRWLPRRRATDLAFPGTDFWVFDSAIA